VIRESLASQESEDAMDRLDHEDRWAHEDHQEDRETRAVEERTASRETTGQMAIRVDQDHQENPESQGNRELVELWERPDQQARMAILEQKASRATEVREDDTDESVESD